MMAATMLLVNSLNLHPGELLIEADLLHSHRPQSNGYFLVGNTIMFLQTLIRVPSMDSCNT